MRKNKYILSVLDENRLDFERSVFIANVYIILIICNRTAADNDFFRNYLLQ